MIETQIADSSVFIKLEDRQLPRASKEDLASATWNSANIVTNNDSFYLLHLPECLCANLSSSGLRYLDGSNVLKQQYAFNLIVDMISIV